MQDLHEHNPMLGLRGCRLSIYFPGIVKMQVGAIIGAACEVKKAGMDVHPEIMIPLIGTVNELTYLKDAARVRSPRRRWPPRASKSITCSAP